MSDMNGSRHNEKHRHHHHHPLSFASVHLPIWPNETVTVSIDLPHFTTAPLSMCVPMWWNRARVALNSISAFAGFISVNIILTNISRAEPFVKGFTLLFIFYFFLLLGTHKIPKQRKLYGG